MSSRTNVRDLSIVWMNMQNSCDVASNCEVPRRLSPLGMTKMQRNYVLGLADGDTEAAGEIPAFFSSRFALRASLSAFSASVNGPSFTIFASIEPSGIL